MGQDMPKQQRGFALLSADRIREIASKGGSSVPSEKRAFSRDKDLAITAGRKGGEANSNVPKEHRRDGRVPDDLGPRRSPISTGL